MKTRYLSYILKNSYLEEIYTIKISCYDGRFRRINYDFFIDKNYTKQDLKEIKKNSKYFKINKKI